MHVTFVSDSDTIWVKIGAAAFKHLFPEIGIRICLLDSAVIERENASVINLITGWGISGIENQKVNTHDFTESILSSRMVIVSSLEIASYVLAISPTACIEVCTGISENSTLSGDEFESLCLRDQGVLAAKLLHKFYNAAVKMTGNSFKNEIIAFTPLRSIDGDLALAMAQFEASINQGIVVVADFRAKDFQAADIHESILTFDPTNLTVTNFDSIPAGSVLFPSREFSQPEKKLLSNTWFNFITQLSLSQSINLVTAPKYSSGQKFSDSYLAAGVAGTVYIVGVP